MEVLRRRFLGLNLGGQIVFVLQYIVERREGNINIYAKKRAGYVDVKTTTVVSVEMAFYFL